MPGKAPCPAVTDLPQPLCPACQRCVAGCPAEIDIPRVLRLCADHRGGGDQLARLLRELPHRKQPLDCIGCGACTAHCPQGVDVRRLMGELARRQR